MEDNTFTPNEGPKPKTASITLGYGLLLALASIIFSLILFLLVEDKMTKLNYLNYLIVIAGIVLAQLNFRDKHMGGFISYGKSFSVGFLTALFSGIVVAVYTYIFFKYISPGTIDEIMQLTEQKMMDKGLSDQELEMAMSWTRKFQTPLMYLIFTFLGTAFMGVIISLITSIFVKKVNPEEPVV